MLFYQVGLVSPGEKIPFCGGSIISKQHVLTAAHCTIDRDTDEVKVPEAIEVLVGEHNTADNIMDARAISAITNHPSFDKANLDFDFSILTLKSSLAFSSTVAPICIPASVSSLYTNSLATVTGWGETASGYSSSTLQKVDVTVLSNQQCVSSYGSQIKR